MTDLKQFIKIVQQYVEMGADAEKAHELAERAFTFVSQQKVAPKAKVTKPVTKKASQKPTQPNDVSRRSKKVNEQPRFMEICFEEKELESGDLDSGSEEDEE